MSSSSLNLSLFNTPKLKTPIVYDHRILLYGDQAALRVKICALGILDQFVELKKKLTVELKSYIGEKVIVNALTSLIEKIKPLRNFYDPSKEQGRTHITSMIDSTEKVYKQLKDQNSDLSKLVFLLLAQYRKTLTEWDNENSDPKAKEYVFSFRGLKTGYRYISREAIDQILPLGRNDSLVKSLETGSRPVSFFDNNYWKARPTGPFYELAFHLLGKHTCKMSSAPSEFVMFQRKITRKDKTYYTQSSLGTQGTGMHKIIREKPDWIIKFCPVLYGFTMILHLLGLPQDAKPDNFIAIPVYDQENKLIKVIWKGIDEDECFAHPVCRVGKGEHIVNCRSFFFCLPQIYERIHPDVRKHFSQINPASVTLEWLYELSEANQLVKDFLDDDDVVQLKKLQKMHMPLYLLEDVVPKLYAKLNAIKTLLESPTAEITYMDLFKKITPELAYFYDVVNQSFPKDPGAAFNHIFIAGGPTYEDLMRPMLHLPLFSNIPLADSLKQQCTNDLVDYLNMRNTTPEKGAEQLLHELNFEFYSTEEQHKILQQLKLFSLNEITIRNSSALTDSDIKDIMRVHPHLKRLNLINCPLLTEAAWDVMVLYNRKLELTIQECPGLSKKEELQNYFSKIVARDRRQTLVVPLSPPPALSETDRVLSELSLFLQQGQWPQIMEKMNTLKDTPSYLQAIIYIIQKLLTSSLMEEIVKTNQIPVLNFLVSLKVDLTQKDPKGQTFYHLCCEWGNTEMLLWLCQQNVAWKELVDKKTRTPCHTAVENGRADCLKILTDHAKPLINQTDKSGTSPLRLAMERREIQAAKILLAAEAKLDEKNSQGKNLMHTLCETGLEMFFDHLMSRVPDLVNQPDGTGRLPIFSAIESNQLQIFGKILPVMKSVNIPDKKGLTGLMVAAQLNRHEHVTLLVKSQADLQVKDSDGMTAAHLAALAGALESLVILLGATPGPATWKSLRKDNKSYLHLAAMSRNPSTVQWLCDQKHPLQEKDSLDLMPAHYAAIGGHWDAFALFLKRGFSIDLHSNPEQQTPLMFAVKGRHFEMVVKMKEAGANFLATNIQGDNLLHQAARTGDKVVIEYLCDVQKMNVNALNEKRKITALHLASSAGHIDAVNSLLSRGAQIGATDLDGKTPLLSAMHTGHEAVAKLLASKGADITSVKKDGWTSLHYATNYTHPKLVHFILSLHPELISKKSLEDGHTPLHKAMYQQSLLAASKNLSKEQLELERQRQIEVIKILLRYGAEVNGTDNFGYVALHLAVAKGRKDFVELLLSRGARTDMRYKTETGSKTPVEHGLMMAGKEPDPNKKAAVMEAVEYIQQFDASINKAKITLKFSDRSLIRFLQRSTEDQKKDLLQNIKDDQGFRRESLLILRTLEPQLNNMENSAKQAFWSTLRDIFGTWNLLLPDNYSKQVLHVNLTLPVTQEHLLTLYLAQPVECPVEEVTALIPLLGSPTDFLQYVVNFLEANKNLTNEQVTRLCILFGYFRGNEAFFASDFPAENCKKIIKSLEKHKNDKTRDYISTAKEFLSAPGDTFFKYRPDHRWKKEMSSDYSKKFHVQLTQALDKSSAVDRESLLEQLVQPILNVNAETFISVQFKDYLQAIAPNRFPIAHHTALSVLMQMSSNLTINALAFLMQDLDSRRVVSRQELIIEWMNRSIVYGDFHQAYSLFKAFMHPATSRLHKTRNKLSSTSRQQLTQAETLFSPAAQYQNYFSVLHERISPSIPAFGIMWEIFSNSPPVTTLFQNMKELQAYRAFAKRLILPAQANAGGHLFLMESFFPSDTHSGESFTWGQSRKIEPLKKIEAPK